MTDTRGIESQVFDPVHSRRLALALLLVLLAFHTLAVWGYAGTVWSDHGHWLDAVERYAAGQVPYRDFDWHQPPLALWLIGGLARFTSADLAPVTAITAAVAVLVFVAYLYVCAGTASGSALPATLTGLLFATAYASRYGPPLPLGSSSPTGPVGIVFLLVGIAAAVRLRQGSRPLVAAVAGAAAGLVVLTRFDLWVAAGILAAWASWTVRHAPERHVTRRALWSAFGLVVVTGVAFTFAQAGPAATGAFLPSAMTDAVLNSLPSWERLTIELAATAALGIAGVVALWLCLALDDGHAWLMGGGLLLVFLSACAVHLGMTTAIGHALAESATRLPRGTLEEAIQRINASGQSHFRTALYLLDQRFQQHLFPALLPPVLIAILLGRWSRWPQTHGRDVTLLLLTVGLALRLHRGLSGPDWYNVLVEIPAYAVFLHLVAASAGREAQRSVSVALAIMLAVGCYTYYNLGRGPLTLRRYPAVETTRGTVRWAPAEVIAFRTIEAEIERLDPGRVRPLFAIGPSGGWNYFLGRANPTRHTRGILTEGAADSAGRTLDTLAVPPIIVDDRRGLRMTRLQPGPRTWEVTELQNRWRLYRPPFEALVVGCRGAAAYVQFTDVGIYDCPVRRPVMPPDSSP